MNRGASIAFYVLLGLLLRGVNSSYWGAWYSWTSSCSETCSNGTQYRWRVCLGIGQCIGDGIQNRSCYLADTCRISVELAISTKSSSPKSTTLVASCYDSDHPQEYRGTESFTQSGKKCQAWESQSPRQHKFLENATFGLKHMFNSTPERYPDAGLTQNYCRTPDGDSKPWCLPKSGSRYWEYCSIPICQDLTTTDAPVTTQCGIRERSQPLKEAIVGGEDAGLGMVPWQVSLRDATYRYHFCGGSIINENWILTASHCVINSLEPSKYYAVLGDYNRSVSEGTEKEVGFVLIVPHEKFQIKTFLNDIALMKVRNPVSFTAYISPICLPKKDEMLEENDMVSVSGWGTTKGTGDNTVLRKVDVPIISNSHCRRLLAGIYSKMVCAGYLQGGKDACQGDSGGPLYRKTDGDKFVQVGIVSWGYGCAEVRLPGVYTRISEYVGWIHRIMEQFTG